jgi:hypothetical protein
VGQDKYSQNSTSFSAEPAHVLFSRTWLTNIAAFIAPIEVPATMSNNGLSGAALYILFCKLW